MRQSICRVFLAAMMLPQFVLAADQAATDKLNDYLVDITGGSVSAGALVGLDKGITQIETSQDISVALQPLISGDSKSAFGFAITPARTSLTPMSGSSYVRNDVYRLLGSLTISYAQNKVTVSGADYKESAYSIGTVYYFNKADDPVAIGNAAFNSCLTPEIKNKNAADIDTIVKLSKEALSDEGKQAALEALTAKLNDKLSPCIDAALKKNAKWNASKASLTYGEARITKTGDEVFDLAKSVTLNAQFGMGSSSLFATSVRSIRKGLDVTSLGGASGPSYKNSVLVAARYTYGDVDDSSLRGIIEASNAKSTSSTVYKDAYLYALGLDKKLAAGMWLELRVGRNRTLDAGKQQTTALMNLNIVPSLLSFKK